jgi:hypothetical protein
MVQEERVNSKKAYATIRGLTFEISTVIILVSV